MAEDLEKFLSHKLTKPINMEKIIQLISDGVVFLAKIKSIPNEEKKPLLLNTIKELLDKSDIPNYQKIMLIALVDDVGSSVIEQLIILGKDTISFIKRKCCI